MILPVEGSNSCYIKSEEVSEVNIAYHSTLEQWTPTDNQDTLVWKQKNTIIRLDHIGPTYCLLDVNLWLDHIGPTYCLLDVIISAGADGGESPPLFRPKIA